ncbi:gp31 [Sodalis phage phiSG1]|uniref:endolysin n=1 Tax=Sodalis phage phiSG1 TaxID=373126 RepID=UPI00006C5C08|nr:endolysin [Sodalis phage phiSG1]ABN42238.1 gp31 [Sodalis phage phiSG1]BAE80498.1 putative phage lysozyme [Sodalis phage phiSG1]
MHLSENGRLLIMRLEGGRLRAYQCRAGIWTIGYGHTEGVKPGDKISLDQALELFNHDVQWAVDAVNALVKVPLSQGQFEALCSFVFNVGRAAFAQSRLLKKLNAGDVAGAAAEFPRWDRGGGGKNPYYSRTHPPPR